MIETLDNLLSWTPYLRTWIYMLALVFELKRTRGRKRILNLVSQELKGFQKPHRPRQRTAVVLLERDMVIDEFA